MTGSGALSVSVSPDKLAAYLEVTASSEPGALPPTVEQALAALAAADVTFGIDQAYVVAALDSPGRAVPVAVGRSPHDGQDGRVQYADGLLATGGRPHVNNSGQVDLFDLDLVHNIKAGALLATRTRATAGEPGTSVFGKPISARSGRVADVLAGAGTRLGDDGAQVFATTAGHASLVGNLLTVSDIYIVGGDVGPSTGNIEFVGSVCVSGSVHPGYRVWAGGDVEIQGTVAGDVEAIGNISVRYGIQGHGSHGRVVAGGAVRARFIEFAVVRAGGSVYASDGIIRSFVETDGKVEVLGHHGSIVGGRIQAAQGVSARGLGSPGAIPTEIVVGTDHVVLDEAREARGHATLLIRQLDQVQQRIVELQRQQRPWGLGVLDRQELEKCHLVYRSLLAERAQLNHRQQELDRLVQALRGALVVAKGTCHPEVRITIGATTHLVREPWTNIRFERNLKTYNIELIQLANSHPA